jgi:hypothetical protein
VPERAVRGDGRTVGAIGAAFAAASTLLAAPAPAAAQGLLDGRLSVAWQSFERGDVATEGLRQRYELAVDRPLTDTFDLRLALRYEQDASGSTVLGEERTADYRALEPRLALRWALPNFELAAEAVRTETRTESDARVGRVTAESASDRMRAALDYTPDGLPALGLEAARERVEIDVDGATRGERLDQRVGGSLGWAVGAWSLAGYARHVENRDDAAGFEVTSDEAGAGLDWSRSFRGDLLSVHAGASGTSTRFEDRRAPAGGVPVPVPVAASASTVDPTPEDHFDRPLAANPRLRDGDRERPAGIRLGPDGEAFTTLAVDLGSTAPVDELRVVVRDPAGRPVTTGGAVEWEVWTSADGLLWRRLAEPAATRFDAAGSWWAVTFPQRLERRIQLVTFFVNGVPTEVTEVEVRGRAAAAAGEPGRRETESWRGVGGVALRPHSSLALGFEGSVAGASRIETRDRELETSDREQSWSASWAPGRHFELALQRTARESTAEGFLGEVENRLTVTSGVVQLRANSDLHLTLDASRTREEAGAASIEVERAFARAFARVYPGLELGIDVGEQRQTAAGEGGTLVQPSIALSLRARPRRDLQVTAAASRREAEWDGAPPAGAPAAGAEERWSVDLFWQPSSQLAVGATAGRAGDGGGSTPVHGWRLQWNPFLRGALRIDGRYDEDVDPVSDRRTRRLFLTPRWQVNDRLALNLSWFRLETVVAGRSDAQTALRSTLTFDF